MFVWLHLVSVHFIFPPRKVQQLRRRRRPSTSCTGRGPTAVRGTRRQRVEPRYCLDSSMAEDQRMPVAQSGDGRGFQEGCFATHRGGGSGGGKGGGSGESSVF
ncbi:unnamed protein product [Phaeothamnion confervicola]